MTHGSLRIRRPSGDMRYVLLHTYHTGMDIPKWVEAVPRLDVRTQFEFLRKGRPYTDITDLDDFMCSQAGGDGYDYPPWVAGLVIAVAPRCLHPMPGSYSRDVTTTMTFELRVESDWWVLRNASSDVVLEFDPYERAIVELHKFIVELSHEQQNQNKT